jgi:putative ATP-binding cassette transporter
MGTLIWFLRPILRRSWVYFGWSSLFGVASGFIYVWLILILSQTLRSISTHDASTERRIAILLVLGIVSPLAFLASQSISAFYAQRTILDIRSTLVNSILALHIADAEIAGSASLLTILTNDVSAIGRCIAGLPTAATNVTIIILTLAFVLWNSPRGFVVAALIILVAAIAYHIFSKKALFHFQSARKLQERLYYHFRLLIDGVKELRLSVLMRERFYSECVNETAGRISKENFIAWAYYSLGNTVATSVVFLALVVLLYWSNSHYIDPAVLLTYVLFALFLVRPVEVVISSVPLFGDAMVSATNIQAVSSGVATTKSVSTSARQPARLETVSMELRSVCFSYPAGRDGYGFQMGPVDLKVMSGTIVFLTGGNGSGKSTLIKLLAGLYMPLSGEVLLNGVRLTAQSLPILHESVSLVSSDTLLHELPWSFDLNSETIARLQEMLSYLGLEQKVHTKEHTFQHSGLSYGQQKRLSLLTAYLQNRNVYCFDEWAANQELRFREWFYLSFLPELKRAGKLVFVASHDESYFDCSDVLVKLDMGRIISCSHRTAGDEKAFKGAMNQETTTSTGVPVENDLRTRSTP